MFYPIQTSGSGRGVSRLLPSVSYLFLAECQIHCNSDYGRHVYVLPGVMLLLPSPLSTLTAYSGVDRVNHLFVYLLYHAAEHLRTYLALSRFRAQPSSTLPFRFPREGRGAKEVLSWFTHLSRQCRRRSIRDIGVLRTCGTEVEFKAGLVSGGTCTCRRQTS